MIFIHFEVEEAAKVFELFTILDSWNTLKVDKEFWLELQGSSGELFNSKCDTFVHMYCMQAHWHHLLKQFNNIWFSRSSLVTTAASSANWNQCIGWYKRSLASCREKPN